MRRVRAVEEWECQQITAGKLDLYPDLIVKLVWNTGYSRQIIEGQYLQLAHLGATG